MKTALICPVPDLEKYVGQEETYHLILAHLLDETPTGKNYREFYRSRAELGDYVTIDNGAKELGQGLSLKHLLNEARLIGAKEVVLPDVRYECDGTIQSGLAELRWLRTDEGMEAFERAGFPALMVVPQGDTPDAWAKCLDSLAYSVMTTIGDLPAPYRKIVVGVAYHYDHMFDVGLEGLLKHMLLFEIAEVHLLGWTRRLETLREIGMAYGDSIRSVDSSRPFVWGGAGLPCGAYDEYPQRGQFFFQNKMNPEYEPVIRANIELFKDYARDRSTDVS